MVQPAARATLLQRLRGTARWDLVVIGGGATGLGVALDAAARGFAVALVEAHDFAKGTSSRATKLVHGGVRYLAQGNVALVREALHERATLLANAPHVAQPLAFVMPGYGWWETPFYGAGLKMYDALAGRRGLGPPSSCPPPACASCCPACAPQGLSGGVKYWDGQFDDARLAVAAGPHGARPRRGRGQPLPRHGAGARARQGGRRRRARCRDRRVVRAAAPAASSTRPASGSTPCCATWTASPARPHGGRWSRRARACTWSSIASSCGPGRPASAAHALLVPRTADGRVLFAVPWLGKTDPRHHRHAARGGRRASRRRFAAEVEFILRESARYLARAPTRADVRSVWVGLRPLVRASAMEAENTKALSREHTVVVGRSGLVTVTGGKWTTYRAMAEDVLDQCFDRALLPRRAGTPTERLPLVGAHPGRPLTGPPGEHLYGSEAAVLRSCPVPRDGCGAMATAGLSEAMVRFAARHEMARDVEDVLARRSRLLFLDARAAEGVADDDGRDPRRRTRQRLRRRRVQRCVQAAREALPDASDESRGLADALGLSRTISRFCETCRNPNRVSFNRCKNGWQNGKCERIQPGVRKTRRRKTRRQTGSPSP